MSFLIEKQHQANKVLLFSFVMALLVTLLLVSALSSDSGGGDLIWRKIASAVVEASLISQ